MVNLESFKNLYEVRKNATFKIVPKKILRQKEDRGSIYNTEDIVKQYKGYYKRFRKHIVLWKFCSWSRTFE